MSLAYIRAQSVLAVDTLDFLARENHLGAAYLTWKQLRHGQGRKAVAAAEINPYVTDQGNGVFWTYESGLLLLRPSDAVRSTLENFLNGEVQIVQAVRLDPV